MSLNVEKIEAYLKRFEAMSPEEKARRQAEMDEDARREQLFLEGERMAEEAEYEMIAGPLDEVHGSPELRRKVEEANADWKAEEHEKDLR